MVCQNLFTEGQMRVKVSLGDRIDKKKGPYWSTADNLQTHFSDVVVKTFATVSVRLSTKPRPKQIIFF